MASPGKDIQAAVAELLYRLVYISPFWHRLTGDSGVLGLIMVTSADHKSNANVSYDPHECSVCGLRRKNLEIADEGRKIVYVKRYRKSYFSGIEFTPTVRSPKGAMPGADVHGKDYRHRLEMKCR